MQAHQREPSGLRNIRTRQRAATVLVALAVITSGALPAISHSSPDESLPQAPADNPLSRYLAEPGRQDRVEAQMLDQARSVGEKAADEAATKPPADPPTPTDQERRAIAGIEANMSSGLTNTDLAPAAANLAAQERATPAARQERADSADQFADASAHEALADLRDSFPAVVDNPVFAPADSPEGNIEKIVSPRTAVVKSTDQQGHERRSLVNSTLPLESDKGSGRLAPVDLGLTQEGASYQSENPIVAAEIATHAAGGVSLPDAGITVHAADSSDPPLIVKDKAFFANAGGQAGDSDLIVTPQPMGFEIAWQLRSAESLTQSRRLEFDMPSGAGLSLDGKGGARIAKDDRTLATIEAPVTTDADGRSVAVSYKLAGDALTVAIENPGGDWHLPILLDPVVNGGWIDQYQMNPDGTASGACMGNWDGAAGEGWYAASSAGYFGNRIDANGGTSWTNSKFDAIEWCGLHMKTRPSVSYSAGDWAEWIAVAPGDSTISAVNFSSTNYTPSTAACTLEGVWDTNSGNWDGGWWQEANGHTGSSPWYAWNGEGAPSDHHFNSCLPTPAGTNIKQHHPLYPHPGNAAIFGEYLRAPASNQSAEQISLWGSLVYLSDANPPTQWTAEQGRPTGWVDRAQQNLNVSASDGGLGVKYFNFWKPVDDGNGQQHWALDQRTHACSIGARGRCPSVWNQDFSYDTNQMPEGVNALGVIGYDALVNQATNPDMWYVKVDRSKPTLSLSGDLYDAYDEEVDMWNGRVALSASATDPGSGVKSMELTVDGTDADPANQRIAVDCPVAGNCPLSKSLSIDPQSLPDGPHTIAVVAKDMLNHVNAESWSITINHSQPQPGCTATPEENSANGPCVPPVSQTPQGPDFVNRSVSDRCDVASSGTLYAGGDATQTVAKQSLADWFPASLSASTSSQFDGHAIQPGLQLLGNVLSGSTSFVKTELSTDVASGLKVGEGPASVCLEPQGVSGGPAELVGTAAALFGEVKSATDLLVRTTPLGTQQLIQFRSPSGSHALQYRVPLSGGEKLTRLTDGSIAVVAPWVAPDQVPDPPDSSFDFVPSGEGVNGNSTTPNLQGIGGTDAALAAGQSSVSAAQNSTDGYVLAVLQRPWALDRSGGAVPATISFLGDVITVSAQPGATASYPVLLETSIDSSSARYDAASTSADRVRRQSLEQQVPSAGTSGCYGPGQYCKLGPEEKAFCTSPSRFDTCYFEFRPDSKDAITLTEYLFLPRPLRGSGDSRETFDSTKANSFQHAYWVAEMTRSQDGSDKELAYEFAVAHEEHMYDSRDQQTAYRSRMDMHQNRWGYRYGSINHTQGYQEICSYARANPDRATVGVM